MVYVLGSEHDERTGQRLQAFRLDSRILPVSGGEDRVQIGYSTTCAFNSRLISFQAIAIEHGLYGFKCEQRSMRNSAYRVPGWSRRPCSR